MPVREVDFILNHILDNYPKVSDINVSVGRPFQVEVDGELIPVEFRSPFRLSPRFRPKRSPCNCSTMTAVTPTCSLNRAQQTSHMLLGIGRVFASIFSPPVAIIPW